MQKWERYREREREKKKKYPYTRTLIYMYHTVAITITNAIQNIASYIQDVRVCFAHGHIQMHLLASFPLYGQHYTQSRQSVSQAAIHIQPATLLFCRHCRVILKRFK